MNNLKRRATFGLVLALTVVIGAILYFSRVSIVLEPVYVEFYSAESKQEWVSAVASRFNQANKKCEDGRSIIVRVKHIHSGASLEKILSEDPNETPTIWSPGNHQWLKLLDDRWERKFHTKITEPEIPTVETTLVLAMWVLEAKAMGWPREKISWDQLIKFGVDGVNGKAFKFGLGDPQKSTSAMLAVLSALYASAGKTSNLELKDFENPKVLQTLKRLSKTAAYSEQSSSEILERMKNEGSRFLNVAVVHENGLLSFNKTQPAHARLVAFYPKDGIFWESHPAAIVTAKWVSKEQAAAAKVFLDFIREHDQQKLACEYGFRPYNHNEFKDEISNLFDEAHGIPPLDKQESLSAVPLDVFERTQELWKELKKSPQP